MQGELQLAACILRSRIARLELARNRDVSSRRFRHHSGVLGVHALQPVPAVSRRRASRQPRHDDQLRSLDRLHAARLRGEMMTPIEKPER